MNRDQADARSFDLDVRIDRLVGNDLSDADRRALLLRIEATPDGWRRCALAFLEDQAWRSALTKPTANPGVDLISTPEVPLQRPNLALRSVRYALAAGIATIFAGACFWAGMAATSRSLPSAIAQGPGGPRPDAATVATGDEAGPGEPLGWLGVMPSTADGVVQSVPILADSLATELWLRDQPDSIPDYVRAQWERRGFQVEENRRLVGLDLQDGRRVAIPVDEVAVDYVGRTSL